MPQNKIRTEDIVNSQITYAKIQNVSNNNLLLGRNTAGAGLIEELNAATAKAILALNNVENVALSTWTGSTNINTLGTITQGTWSGSTISINKGGTGLNTLGTANQVLAVNSGGTALQYVTPLSGTGTSEQVTFWGGTNTLSGSTNLTYNGSNVINFSAANPQLIFTSSDNANPFGLIFFARFRFAYQENVSQFFLQGTNTVGNFVNLPSLIINRGSNNNVGINLSPGSPGPLSQFVVAGNTYLAGSNGTAAARLHVIGSGTTLSGWTAQFHNSGGTSNSLMIRDDGNIGINTNTPNARLQVHGADTADTGWTAQFHNVNGNSNSLMIRNDGNVGIGTNAPASTFDVVGSVEFQNPTSAFDGGVLGSELLTTGTGTNWTGTSFASGYTHTIGSTAALTSAFTPTNGQFYRIVVTTTGVTTGSTTVTFGGLTIGTLSTNTTITVDDRTSSTAALVFTPTSEFNGTVTASVRLISASSPQFVGKSLNGTVVYEERLSNSNTNIFQGVDTGRLNTTGTFNVFQGRNSGRSNTTGNNNLFQGADSGYSNITGSFNIFQGASTGYSNTTGSNNLFQGSSAGYFNTIGSFNIFQGARAGYSNTTGNANIFQGYLAGYSNTTGYYNFFQGYLAGFSNTTGNSNIIQGYEAGYSNTTGNRNVLQGYQAGRYIVGGLTGNTIINNSILIGYDSRALASGETNQVVIGYEGRGLGSNTTVIGNTSTTQTHLHGSLTLGSTNTPTARLVVRGSGATSGSTTMLVENSGGTSMLMVREDGNVGIGTNAPTTRLDVSGTARVQGTTTITPAANTSAITSTGYSVTGSDTTRMIDLSGTWNTTGNVTAINLDITNTASGVNSNLINCSINGTTNIFSVRRTGEVIALSNYSFHSSNGSLSATSTLTIQTAASQTAGTFLNKSASVTATSGDFPTITLNNTPNSFAPTSGTATFTSIRAIPTINQTGGANGITRGIIVSPTLTSAFDWRSIEWTNSSGWGLYGEGTANNYLGGNLSVGTTGSTAKLVVVGSQPSGMTTWTAQFHNALGNSNSLMIRDDGNVGIGTNDIIAKLNISGSVRHIAPTNGNGGVLGTQLTITGSGTNWSGTSFTDGYTHTVGSTAALTTATSIVTLDSYYQLRIVISNRTAGFITVFLGGQSFFYNTNNNPFGDIQSIKATSTSALIVTPTSDFDGTVQVFVNQVTSGIAAFSGMTSNGVVLGVEERYSPTNVFIGKSAGMNNIYTLGTYGSNNVFIGHETGIYNVTGYQNMFLGSQAGRENISGSANLFLGNQAGRNNTMGYNNMFQGSQAGFLNTVGSFNVFQGVLAGYFNTSGNSNVFTGYSAGYNNTVGLDNVFQGVAAGFSNTTGGSNTFVGRGAGYSNTTGNWNVFQGFASGFNNTNGSLNVSIGYLAGYYITAGTINTKLDNSILIGHDTRVPATGQTNQIVIGDQARGLGSNTTVIGNTGTTISLIHGNVSAGETNPKNKLETSGSFGRGSLVQVSTSSYTVGNNDTWIRVSTASGTVALTLPDATAWIRREIMIIKTSGATVISASANVVKFAGAGTAILGGDDLRCTLVSDGTNWYFM